VVTELDILLLQDLLNNDSLYVDKISLFRLLLLLQDFVSPCFSQDT
jgi:hypothetical protein